MFYISTPRQPKTKEQHKKKEHNISVAVSYLCPHQQPTPPPPVKIMNAGAHSHSCAQAGEEAPPRPSWANGARRSLITLLPGWPMAHVSPAHMTPLCALPRPLNAHSPASAVITEDLTSAESDVHCLSLLTTDQVLFHASSVPQTSTRASLPEDTYSGSKQRDAARGETINAQKLLKSTVSIDLMFIYLFILYVFYCKNIDFVSLKLQLNSLSA